MAYPERRKLQQGSAVIGPRNMVTDLQPRHSTKQLIKRYESMSNHGVPVQRSRPATSSLGTSAKFFRAIGASKENLSLTRKDRSHIRQSFSNLLSVFKIGNSKYSSEKSDNLGYMRSGSLKRNPGKSTSSGVEHDTPQSGPGNQPTAQKGLHSGTLLYLSHPQAGQRASLLLPVWTACTVVLKRREIHMTWLTAQGNPSTHVISLVSCTDVRSLPLEQLDPSEMALLPTAPDSDMRVFELLFEGQPREKFAATSVQQRAEWVSAIWDDILPSQGPLGDASNLLSKTAKLGTNQSRRNSERPGFASCGKAFTRAQSCDAERSLPPTPVEPQFAAFHYPSDDWDMISHIEIGDNPRVQHVPLLIRSNKDFPTISPKPGVSASTEIADMPIICDKSKVSSIVESSLRGVQHRDSMRSDGGHSIIDSYGDTRSPEIVSNEVRYSAAECAVNGDSTSPPPSHAEKQLDILDSPASQYHTPSETKDDSLAELLRGQASQITGLGGNLSSMLEHLQALGSRIETLTHATPLLTDINQAIKNISEKADRQGEDIRTLFDKVNEIGHQQLFAASYCKAIDPIRGMLEDVWNQSRSELPRVFRVLEDIHAMQLDRRSAESHEVNMQNLRPSSYIQDDVAKSADNPSHALSVIEGKLDELLTLCQTSKVGDPGDGQAHTTTDVVILQQATQELRAILDSLQTEEGNRHIREQRQEDSVRYLNELNSWLETFVKTSTTQMQETALGIRKICHELGSEAPASSLPGSGVQPAQTVLGDIRQLIFETRKREADSVELKRSLDALACSINTKTDIQNGFTPETVMELLNRQRQDQEKLLKALTAELSSEIRGERLRFVDAMKEATAINVQIHVEQFKKELNREVMVMTREIERLHREKQVIENKIADLFAFYSKHRQTPVNLDRYHIQRHSLEGVQVNAPPATQHQMPPSAQNTRPMGYREVGYQ